MKRSTKRIAIILAVFISSIGLFSFVESYFEISKNLDIFSAVYREVNVNYVEETNPGNLIKTGIDAMLNSLDPYTNYIPESDIEDYRFMTTHEYGGIGAMIGTRGDNVMITEPYENSPAAKAGLKAGDILLEVDGQSAKGKKSSELSEMLRGQNGTQLKMKVNREATGEIKEFIINRDKIKLDDVPYYGMVDSEIGYISLSGFTETASREVRKALEELKAKGASKLILDLRGNGGGLLSEAVNIVNLFVAKGETVVEVKGKLREHYSLNKALQSPVDEKIPLVVMIDEGSASASEIVAGTLQDLDRAVVIGQNSYGKGLVQTTHDLSYSAKIKITIAKYYTPSGRCIQRIDYGSRDDKGKAIVVADSLMKDFKTRNGRVVKDGAGITPDLRVEDPLFSELLITLLNENILFDWATKYYYSHDTIVQPEDFKLTDAEYNAFKQFALSHEFEYRTSSMEMTKELKKTLEEDEFWEEVKAEYDLLIAKLERDKGRDLEKFQDEIRLMLEGEIIGRYYYAKGRIRAYMAHDPDVVKSKEVLNNKSTYDSVLSGACADCLIKKG